MLFLFHSGVRNTTNAPGFSDLPTALHTRHIHDKNGVIKAKMLMTGILFDASQKLNVQSSAVM